MEASWGEGITLLFQSISVFLPMMPGATISAPPPEQRLDQQLTMPHLGRLLRPVSPVSPLLENRKWFIWLRLSSIPTAFPCVAVWPGLVMSLRGYPSPPLPGVNSKAATV